MTQEEYWWHWWELNRELRRILRRTTEVERGLRNLEREMSARGIEKPKVKPKLQ
jgi:hypothetical protein